MSSKNFLSIMSMKEDDITKVVFEREHKEGGINTVYDPTQDQDYFQVYVNCRLPLVTESSWLFSTFSEARLFAAKYFDSSWTLLAWNFKTHRPCEKEGRECGSGTCETCVSLKKDILENGEQVPAAGCGTATGRGSCGYA